MSRRRLRNAPSILLVNATDAAPLTFTPKTADKGTRPCDVRMARSPPAFIGSAAPIGSGILNMPTSELVVELEGSVPGR
jgi:hypothetical protein